LIAGSWRGPSGPVCASAPAASPYRQSRTHPWTQPPTSPPGSSSTRLL